jgi:hypothetical protein
VIVSGSPKLRWSPPGFIGGNPRDPANFPGYTVIGPYTSYAEITLNDNTDYFLQLGNAAWSRPPTWGEWGTSIHIMGGRNVVCIGGAITFDPNPPGAGDMSAFLIDDGNPAGIVHIEGVNVPFAWNGVTVRTDRRIQLQNMRIHLENWGADPNHCDIIQTWDRGPCIGLRIHRMSAESSFTSFSVIYNLPADNPLDWEMHDVDLRPSVRPSDGLRHLGNVWMGNPAISNWHGSNLWYDPGQNWDGSIADLGDVCREYSAGNTTPMAAAYEIYDENDTLVYTSPLDPTQGATSPYGTRQGDYMRFDRMPLLTGLQWNAIRPTVADGADANGNFVPASLVGTGYVAPGYI